MENASKALLIAGSILIVILLIAVGMKIFNSTTGTTDSVETTMSATEVAMFNNKFLPYIGDNKSKADVMALINLVIANNATVTRKDNEVTLFIYSVKDGTYRSQKNLLTQDMAEGKYSVYIESKAGISAYNSKGYITSIVAHYKGT